MWQAAVSRAAAFRNNNLTKGGVVVAVQGVAVLSRRRSSNLIGNRQRWRMALPSHQQQQQQQQQQSATTTSIAMASTSFQPRTDHSPQLRPAATKETLHLWETLMVSQQFNLPSTTQEATKQDDWVHYFDQLGSSSVVAIDSVDEVAGDFEDEDIDNDNAEPLGNNSEQQADSSLEYVESESVLYSVQASSTTVIAADRPRDSSISSAQADTTETEETQVDETTKPHSRSTASLPPSDQERFEAIGSFHRSISSWMNRSQPHTAYQIFQRAQRKGFAQDLPLPMIRRLFFDLTNAKYPVEAYNLLSFYRQATAHQCNNDPSGYVDEYARLCDSFRHLDPRKNYKGKIESLVRITMQELRKLDRDGQQRCIPLLVSGLSDQRTVQIGRLARPVFKYMVEQDFEVSPGYWEHLLNHSKYNRQDDLPFDQVLEKCMQAGRYPNPEAVLNALANMYPYHDTGATLRMLKCILKIQQTPAEQFHRYTQKHHQSADYRVDLSTLELIGAAAASKGFYDMNLVIWDMMDVLGYEPTEFVYENTILAFLARPATYANAFACLADMEEKGFVPTRALVRSMSSYLRLASQNLHVANGVLKDMRQEGRPTSVAGLNAILSGAAERGDVDRAMSVMDDFACNNLEPDADSYSYALEAFGKTLSRRKVNPASESLMASCLDLADSILLTIEEKGIPLTHHIIRAYVELLCIAKEVETATNVVRQSHAQGLVNNKIIYRVAVTNLEQGSIDVAREMLGIANPPMPSLKRKIREYELIAANELAKDGSKELNASNEVSTN